MMFSYSSGSPAWLAVLFAGAAMLPSALGAQQRPVPSSSADSVQAASSAAPVPAMLRFAPARSIPVVSLAPAGPVAVYMPQDDVRVGSNVAMMAVGGAGLVVGLLIGGDAGVLIASAGGVIGLIGLYRYLR